MNCHLQSLREHVRRFGAAYLVLAIALVPTWVAYARLKQLVGEDSQNALPEVVLIGGLLVSGLLFGIVWVQSNARFTAERLAADLRFSQNRHELLQRATNDAVWDWDLATDRLVWNEAVQMMFGYAPNGIGPGIEWWRERLHADDCRRILNGRESALQTGGEFWADEYRFRRGDGTYAMVIDRGYIVRNNQGAPVRMVGSIVDITASRRAEVALAEEKERLAVTLRSIGDGVITTDIESRINLINKVAEDLTRWRQAEALGKPLSEVFRVLHQKTREPVDNPVAQVLQSGLIVDLPPHTALIARNGAECPIASSAAPIRDKESRVLGAVLVFRDITEQVRMADELLRASKLDSLGILAGGIAHDFNNILTSVIGNLSLAKMYSAAGDKVFPRLEEAEKASVRAKDLTQQLLTFAKGGAPVRQTASIVELIMDSTQFTLRGSNVRCAFFLPEDLWPADVDEGQISQVINNLVINAMQAMPEGGVIQVRAENANLGEDNGLGLPPGRYVRIAVADCGSGIRPEHLAKIFDPFFTTKQTGSGLGLATAYSIIKRHDGLINVESTLGIGTIFRVYLPASNQPVQTPQVVQIGPLAGQGRVLVMDDEPLIRELAVTALETLGYRVHTVPDGAEAVRCFAEAKARGDPFQALVMDLTIPGGMGGKEAVKKILALDPNARAIVSSGYSNDPVMAHFRDHGFRGVVGKPYRIEELAKALSEVIHDGDK